MIKKFKINNIKSWKSYRRCYLKNKINFIDIKLIADTHLMMFANINPFKINSI